MQAFGINITIDSPFVFNNFGLVSGYASVEFATIFSVVRPITGPGITVDNAEIMHENRDADLTAERAFFSESQTVLRTQ